MHKRRKARAEGVRSTPAPAEAEPVAAPAAETVPQTSDDRSVTMPGVSAAGAAFILRFPVDGAVFSIIMTFSDYRRELANVEVLSALCITAQLPELYDYIYEVFPRLYNAADGSYGRITAVRNLTSNRRQKVTPFFFRPVDTLSPDGFVLPLVYGLQALMEKKNADGHNQIQWRQPPMDFLHAKLDKIVANYVGLFSMCDYDPQKIGKNPQSYVQAISAFKMALAGII